LAVPERLREKKKPREKRTRLQHDRQREDFGRKSFAARISSDSLEVLDALTLLMLRCVHVKKRNGATGNWRRFSANGKEN
jgi:hypothetical protein